MLDRTISLSELFSTNSDLTFANHWDHFLARVGYRRSQHRVKSGLYKLGSPDPLSEVFVTANYTLSFDALRSALKGKDAFILVLDTHGVNVWCAAGKGSFGTDELLKKIESTELVRVVDHRNLILPQLGATGVSAYRVKEETGFNVEYGPVRAEDLLVYLETHLATPEMRRVRFNLADRLVLTPVEIVNSFLPALLIGLALYLVGGRFSLLWGIAGWLAAAVLFMVLLPWLPTQKFSIKGYVLGLVVSLPFILSRLILTGETFLNRIMHTLPETLFISTLVAYYGLNLTGSTPLTNWTSVKREIARYIPIMAIMGSAGIILVIARLFGLGG